ncbi:hypothetical protein ACJIZ3_023009 [Penstemon smallii]|uniref:Uncharacterized protein n=1 Tax=Penstemon smallii TaxID=265156 RepID=A0ABD3TPU4_9LAMI
MECRVCFASGELWGGGGGGGGESEHDLAMLVNEFLENGYSDGTESIYSSDSDSGIADAALLAHKISYIKIATDQYEQDLFSVVNSLVLSISERDLRVSNLDPCNASCIRFALVKLLRLSGYDAAVCISRWQKSDKVLGGDHEYIDIVHCNETGTTDRLIIDVDFRSHFEIARAVDSYDRILNSLPVIYVGSFTKLQQFLEVMAEAAISSLKQNSMPLPPWRSYAYLEAKWQSPYQRKFKPDKLNLKSTDFGEHEKCAGRLKRLHSLVKSEIRIERMLKPFNGDRRLKLERQTLRTFTL